MALDSSTKKIIGGSILGLWFVFIVWNFLLPAPEPLAPGQAIKLTSNVSDQPKQDTPPKVNEPKVVEPKPDPVVVTAPKGEPKTTQEPADVDVAIVAEPEPAEPEVAPTQEPVTDQVPKVDEVVEPEQPVAPEAPEPEVVKIVPVFDILRVHDDRSALIAGVAAPNSIVVLLGDGEELGSTLSNGAGEFVFLLDMPKTEDAIELQLQQGEMKSVESVLVLPSPKGAEEAPKIVVAEAEEVIVVQEGGDIAPQIVEDLSLDTINYTEQGNVVLTGRGASDQSVRVYVDNKPVQLGRVEDGGWSFEIPDIDEGIYTLRVDAVDEKGAVTDRVESPFQRVRPEMLEGSVTIQPGFTLWRLAEVKYGAGDRYVQIYEANKDSIKDPDMIFPGQVFDIPDN